MAGYKTTGFGRQKGMATLAIGMLLLLLITMVVLYGARDTILEQRVSASDYKARMAQSAADAGLDQAIENLDENLPVFNSDQTGINFEKSDGTVVTVNGWLSTAHDYWRPGVSIDQGDCDDGYDNYVEKLVCESGLVGTNPGTFYVFDGNQNDASGNDLDSSDNMMGDLDVFPAGTLVPMNDTRTGDEFRVAYKVDYILCPMNFDITVNPAVLQNPPCSNDILNSRYYAVIVESQGYLVDGNGNVIDNNGDGIPDTRAEARQVVTKYDVLGAGPSVPLMVSGTFSGGGTFDIVANPNGGPPPPGGGASGAPISVWSGDAYARGSGATNTCQLYEFYSTGTPTNVSSGGDDYQICTDCECPNNDQDMLLTTNNVKGTDVVDSDPAFPTDLFKYTFGVPEGDAQIIKDLADVEPNCDSFDTDTSGLIWVTGTCSLQGSVGSPSKPTLIIAEGDVTLNAGAIYYGVLYAFNSGTIKLNGGAQVYGAVMADDITGSASGTGSNTIVYDQDVLSRLRVNPDFERVARLPGTWTDTTLNNP